MSLYSKKTGFWNLYNCSVDLLPTDLVPLNILHFDEVMSHEHVSVHLLKKITFILCRHRKGTYFLDKNQQCN